jgi:hypothetical protein
VIKMTGIILFKIGRVAVLECAKIEAVNYILVSLSCNFLFNKGNYLALFLYN